MQTKNQYQTARTSSMSDEQMAACAMADEMQGAVPRPARGAPTREQLLANRRKAKAARAARKQNRGV